MVRQLRESREEMERLHRAQMSRAERFAAIGELAVGLAHEIRNPLAGIAGVIEIVGRDLPVTSPARAVVKDVRLEIAQIHHMLTDLLQINADMALEQADTSVLHIRLTWPLEPGNGVTIPTALWHGLEARNVHCSRPVAEAGRQGRRLRRSFRSWKAVVA